MGDYMNVFAGFGNDDDAGSGRALGSAKEGWNHICGAEEQEGRSHFESEDVHAEPEGCCLCDGDGGFGCGCDDDDCEKKFGVLFLSFQCSGAEWRMAEKRILPYPFPFTPSPSCNWKIQNI